MVLVTLDCADAYTAWAALWPDGVFPVFVCHRPVRAFRQCALFVLGTGCTTGSSINVYYASDLCCHAHAGRQADTRSTFLPGELFRPPLIGYRRPKSLSVVSERVGHLGTGRVSWMEPATVAFRTRM